MNQTKRHFMTRLRIRGKCGAQVVPNAPDNSTSTSSLDDRMKARVLVILLALLAPAPLVSAQNKDSDDVDLTGSWSITWDADAANVNPVKLSQSGGKVEGTYLNDDRETCRVTGIVDHKKGTVSFTIRGPRSEFEIKCDGVLAKRVTGRYLAYGTTKGSFRMSRNQK